MGISIAPFLPHRALGRAVRGQALVDASWALSIRGEGRFDVDFLLGATLIQYPAWVFGTVAGVLAGGVISDPNSLGLDAIFPAFFLGWRPSCDGPMPAASPYSGRRSGSR